MTTTPEADPGAADAPRLLVFGATGYVGSHLVPRLQREGFAVRASARNRKTLEARGWRGVEIVEADALRPETLPRALEGVDTAYYLVHSMAAGRDFGALDLRAAEHFAAAAAAAGVRRIVYLGGLIPPQPDSEHLVSRRDTGERLRRGTVPVTEIRAGIIVGAGSAAYEVMRDLVHHLPLMLTPKWVRSRSAPIALENLLEVLVRIRAIDEAAGRIYDVGGPEMLTYEEMMRRYGELVGKRVRIVPVPLLTPRLSSYWLGLVTAVPANIARALIGGLKHDLPAHDAEIRRLVPQRLLDFREAVQAALDAEREHRVAARWTEGLLMFRGFRIDHAYYAKRASGSAVARASPQAVWHVVATIGGDNGYYALGPLWWLRGAIDWLLGGPGLTKGRRHPTELRLGDRIDYWTVVGLEPGRRLTLHFGMRAPGSGVCEFELEPLPDDGGAPRTRLAVTAYWHPQGVWGLLYWYALVPAHLVLFRRMTAAMARRAEAIDATTGEAREA
ncbi:MAG: SDR family oxidoreductase [Rubrivivax sp.]|nr:SDR family oxidoreductase [Rubrivivax sp.]